MKSILVQDNIRIPKGVKLSVNGRTISVEGKRGKLSRTFNAQVSFSLINRKRFLRIQIYFGDRRHRSCLNTVRGHINNMIKGVTQGFLYKMRLVHAHFPINATVEEEGTKILIRNFLGEKKVREIKMNEGVTAERSKDIKDQIVFSGIDINSVSQSAANVHGNTLVKNKDIRKFLDGVYVSEKGTIEE